MNCRLRITDCGLRITTVFAVVGFMAAGFLVVPNTANAFSGVCNCKIGGFQASLVCVSDSDCLRDCDPDPDNPSVKPGGTCVENPTTNPSTPSGGTTTGTTSPTQLENPLSGVCPAGKTGTQCVQLVIGNIIKTALGIVGSIALLMAIYGGFLWLTSGGNSEKIQKGKAVLIWATIGLAVIFSAYAITAFVIGGISGTG